MSRRNMPEPPGRRDETRCQGLRPLRTIVPPPDAGANAHPGGAVRGRVLPHRYTRYTEYTNNAPYRVSPRRRPSARYSWYREYRKIVPRRLEPREGRHGLARGVSPWEDGQRGWIEPR